MNERVAFRSITNLSLIKLNTRWEMLLVVLCIKHRSESSASTRFRFKVNSVYGTPARVALQPGEFDS